MNSLTIAGIQTNLFWEDKKANLDNLSKHINSLTTKPEIIILPEMFNTGFSMDVKALAEDMNGESVQWIKEQAASHRVIVTGSLIIRENNHYYNRLIWMLPNGEFGFYDKRHLFAFASEHESFSPGSRRLIASVKGWKINLQVCYDLRFPVWARQSSNIGSDRLTEYDLLLYVANWPEARIHAWTTLLQARAIENQCYVIGINRVGQDGKGINYPGKSLVVDPLGNILYDAGYNENIFTYSLQKQALEEARNKYPFLKDADSFILSI